MIRYQFVLQVDLEKGQVKTQPIIDQELGAQFVIQGALGLEVRVKSTQVIRIS